MFVKFFEAVRTRRIGLVEKPSVSPTLKGGVVVGRSAGGESINKVRINNRADTRSDIYV